MFRLQKTQAAKLNYSKFSGDKKNFCVFCRDISTCNPLMSDKQFLCLDKLAINQNNILKSYHYIYS